MPAAGLPGTGQSININFSKRLLGIGGSGFGAGVWASSGIQGGTSADWGSGVETSLKAETWRF